MNALTAQGGVDIVSAAAAGGKAKNTVRALTASEIDEVSGGSTLFIIGGMAWTTLFLMWWGDDIAKAFNGLEEWIKN